MNAFKISYILNEIILPSYRLGLYTVYVINYAALF